MQYYIDCSYSNMSITWAYHTFHSTVSDSDHVCDLWTGDWGTWRWMWHDTVTNLQGTIYLPCTVNCSTGEDQDTSDFIVPVQIPIVWNW